MLLIGHKKVCHRERYIITDLNGKKNVGISCKTELHKTNQLKVI